MKLSSRQALLLRAFSGWTLYVWTVRMWNIWRDDSRDFPFKAVHSVLALISVSLAVAALVVVQRNRRTPAPVPGREADRVSA